MPNVRIEKTDEEWKRLHTPEQFRITRFRRDEKPFQSNLHSCIETVQSMSVCSKTKPLIPNKKLAIILTDLVLAVQL